MRRIALLTLLALVGLLEMPAAAKALRTVAVTGITDRHHKVTATVDSHLRITKLHFAYATPCSKGVADLDHPAIHHDEQRTEGHTLHRHFRIDTRFGPTVAPVTPQGSFHPKFGYHGVFHVSRDGHARVRVHATMWVSELGCSGPHETLSAEFVRHLHGTSTDARHVNVTIHGGLSLTDGGVLEFKSAACPDDRFLRASVHAHSTTYFRAFSWDSKREVLADGTRHVVSHAEWGNTMQSGQLALSAWEDADGHVRVHGIAHLRAWSKEYRRYCEGRAEFWLPN